MLASVFRHLVATIDECRQEMDNLRWATVQAQPNEAHALADHFEAATEDLLDDILQIRDSAYAAQRTVVKVNGWSAARASLAECQNGFIRMSRRYHMELVAMDRIEALAALADEGGKPWAQWVYGLKDALGRCTPLLSNVNEALFQCWYTLSDRVSSTPVLNQAVSSGSTIYVTQAHGREQAPVAEVIDDGEKTNE